MSGFSRSFGGEWQRSKKVSLAGRSRTTDATREEVLERTRLEREARRQHRLETRSAIALQASWRSWRARRKLKVEARERWTGAYGASGNRASAADFAPASPYLRDLLCFADPTAAADVQLLAAACRLLLSSTVPVIAAGLPGGQQQQLELCAHATDGVAVLRAQRLVSKAVAGLARQAPAIVGQLQQPRVGVQAAQGPEPATALVEAVIALTAADSWSPAAGAAHAADITAQIMAHAARHGLFSDLAAIFAVAVPEGLPLAGRASVPAAEALLTSLVVRLLSVQGAAAARLPAPALAPPRLLAGLLCQPLLLQRCPTLRPVGAHLWRAAVLGLHALAPRQLAVWLDSQAAGVPGGAAAAAAALLGNLLEGSTAALRAETAAAAAAARPAAAQLVALASSLLQLLPLAPFFPAPGGVAQLEEAEAAEAEQAAAGDGGGGGAAEVPQLTWDPEQLPSAGVRSQLQGSSDPAFLRTIVRLLLPAATADEGPAALAAAAAAGAPAPGLGGAALSPLLATAASTQQLCSFLRRLLALPGQRQRVLIALAVRGELPQRLWFSYLRAAHDSGGAGWLPAPDGSCDPGWMLPLTLLSLSYSCFISLGELGNRGDWASYSAGIASPF